MTLSDLECPISHQWWVHVISFPRYEWHSFIHTSLQTLGLLEYHLGTQKTRMVDLPGGEKRLMICAVVLDTILTDRRIQGWAKVSHVSMLMVAKTQEKCKNDRIN